MRSYDRSGIDSGIASRVSMHSENESATKTMGKGVPCVSLRTRFAEEYKSPRSPLGEIKLNGNERSSVTPKRKSIGLTTPSVEGTPSKTARTDAVASAYASWRDATLWTTPARSCLIFSSVFLALLTWHYTETGVIDFRPSVSLAYCGLAMLAVNFFGAIFFQNYESKPVVTRAQVERLARTAESLAVSTVPRLNAALSGASAASTLQVAFSLWTLITLSKFMTLSLICLVAHCASFTLPLLYKSFEREVQQNLDLGKRAAVALWDNVNLDRKYKLGGVGVALGCLWVLFDAHTKVVSLFVAVIAFKCFLTSSECETIASVAAPVTTRVSRKAKRISMGAGEILRETIGLRQLVSPVKKS